MHSGETLESQVERSLEYELRHGKLGLNSALASVLRHKAYFSKDRGKNITFDVVIELRLPMAADPWLIWVWECKDLARLVTVDEVEEFHGKLEQIGVHRAKGTLACRNGFQDGTVAYAKSKGIGLARILPDGSIIRLLQAVRTVSDESVRFGLTQSRTEVLTSMFYGLSQAGQSVETLYDLVTLELGTNTESV